MTTCVYGDPQYLLAEGGVRTKAGQFLGRTIQMLTPKMVLASSGVAEAAMVPDLIDQVIANGAAYAYDNYH
mgnify:FL=1